MSALNVTNIKFDNTIKWKIYSITKIINKLEYKFKDKKFKYPAEFSVRFEVRLKEKVISYNTDKLKNLKLAEKEFDKMFAKFKRQKSSKK